MLFPSRLKMGDKVGVVAPAGPPKQEELIKGIAFLEELGLRVKLGQHVHSTYGYLAGHDAERLNDFHDMIANPDIQAIIFARGGYGTGRIVYDIDYDLIKENPKIIWGYSDITYLHTAIRQQTGLVTFHGPMVATDMADDRFEKKSKDMFRQLFEPTTLQYTEQFSPLSVLTGGSVTGQLIGGNLSLIVSTLGTPFEIDTIDKMLLIEDIGEQPYQVDSMLNQLQHAGKLEKLAGVIIGDFAKADPGSKASLSLEEVFSHYFGNLGCPVMSGFKIGHCFPHFAVPLGADASLETKNKTLTVQPGVK